MNAKAWIAAVAVSFLLTACGGGGGGGSGGASSPPPAGSSDWDTMVWDQDNWG